MRQSVEADDEVAHEEGVEGGRRGGMMMMLMDDYLKLIRAECECDSLRFAIMFIANCYAFDLLPLSLSLVPCLSFTLLATR